MRKFRMLSFSMLLLTAASAQQKDTIPVQFYLVKNAAKDTATYVVKDTVRSIPDERIEAIYMDTLPLERKANRNPAAVYNGYVIISDGQPNVYLDELYQIIRGYRVLYPQRMKWREKGY